MGAAVTWIEPNCKQSIHLNTTCLVFLSVSGFATQIPCNLCLFIHPSWSFDRLLNASGEELQALPDAQRTTLFDGPKASHGGDGFRAILQEMSRRRRAGIEAAQPEKTKKQERELLAPFFETLGSVYRSPAPEDWGNWGFVVFRTTPYGVVRHRGSIAKVDRAIELLEFQWVEDPVLEADAAEVARYDFCVISDNEQV